MRRTKRRKSISQTKPPFRYKKKKCVSFFRKLSSNFHNATRKHIGYLYRFTRAYIYNQKRLQLFKFCFFVCLSSAFFLSFYREQSFREKSHHIVIIKHDKTYFLVSTHSHAHTQNAYIRSEKRSFLLRFFFLKVSLFFTERELEKSHHIRNLKVNATFMIRQKYLRC